MSWYSYVLFGFKRRYIDASLAKPLRKALRADAKERGLEIKEKKEKVDQVYFEPGGYGMYAMHQPRTSFELGGKLLEIDCAKAGELLFDLLATEGKDLPDGTKCFYCYSRNTVLCLTAEEKTSLISQLRLSMKEVNQRANKFMERSETAWQADKAKYEEEHGKGSFPILRRQDLPRNELLN